MDELIEHQESDVHAENSVSQSELTPPLGLDKNRKIAVAVLGFLAFFMMIFWVYNLRNKINDPFTYKEKEGEEEISETEETVDMTKDTDKDGLTDYEETNVYNTSPYLDDSDSDGAKDGDEVKNNSNPNCAVGADCNQELVLEKVDTTSGLDSETAVMADILSDVDISNVSQEELKSIREAFLAAGYDKTKLDQMTDQQVYQAYLISLQAYSGQGGNSEQISVEPDKTIEKSVSVSDAKAIREAYEKAGYDKSKLEQISDEDLVRAYQEAMSTYQNKQ